MSTAYLGLVAPELGAEEHVEIERRAIEHGLAHLNDEKLSEMMARSESHNETTGFSFDPLLALATRLERKRRQVEATKSLAGHN